MYLCLIGLRQQMWLFHDEAPINHHQLFQGETVQFP